MCFFCLTEGVGKFGKQIKEFSTTKIFVTAPQNMAVRAPQKFWDHIWNLRFQASIILSHRHNLGGACGFCVTPVLTFLTYESFSQEVYFAFKSTKITVRAQGSLPLTFAAASGNLRSGWWRFLEQRHKQIAANVAKLYTLLGDSILRVCEKKHREPWQFMTIY